MFIGFEIFLVQSMFQFQFDSILKHLQCHYKTRNSWLIGQFYFGIALIINYYYTLSLYYQSFSFILSNITARTVQPVTNH